MQRRFGKITQKELDNVGGWGNTNEMKFNGANCEFLNIGTNNNNFPSNRRAYGNLTWDP